MQKQTLTAIVILVVVLIGGLFVSRNLESISPIVATDTTPTDNTQITADALDGMIHVFDPTEDALLASPLTVAGEARGAWFFEGSFPVRLYDSAGNVLAEGVATSTEDWMTEDFIPFEISLDYKTPATDTGTLVLMKDNPSGDPANDMTLTIPVRFDEVQ